MKTKTITTRDIEQDSNLVWNSFIDLLAEGEYDVLSEEQRPAYLVFWYESEVQNGGHLQYFENRGTKYLAETIAALGLLRADCYRVILQDAANQFSGRERSPIQNVEEYSEVALEGELDELDSRFYSCTPSLIEHLKEHLAQHQSLFVTIT